MKGRAVVHILGEVAILRGADPVPDLADMRSTGNHARYEAAANEYAAANQVRANDGDQATWDYLLLERVYKALAEPNAHFARDELIAVAALAVAQVEAMDERDAA